MQRLVAAKELSGSSFHVDLIAAKGAGAYGALRPSPSRNTGELLLALPDGFNYTVFSRTGDLMSDGNLTPGSHEGMAAFNVEGELRLIRNHRVNNQQGRRGLTIGAPECSYDVMADGGTTTLVIDPKTREVKKDLASLSGSLDNGAGGPTPWGTWISCEETVLGVDRVTDARGIERGGFAKNHGYCFEIFAAADVLKESVPLSAMGRFVHQAVAVDPRSNIVYETEDQSGAGFYRFIPKRKEHLAEGGQLQMLAIKDRPRFDTRTGQQRGARFGATWVEIEHPDPETLADEELSVYRQGLAKGGATFAGLKGCWYGSGNLYFTAANSRDQRLGQLWKYTPNPGDNDGGVLTLLLESTDISLLDSPNDLCASPRGGLVICENDGNEQFIRGLTSEGRVFDLARNLVGGIEEQGFVAPTFSFDGHTLFFNLRSPGMTFAVWGPWIDGAL
ncbi:MAG TPA: alkaline phosphatase PhoX [Blastocatellia bacterium]|nr:alkaline phosphatase PhoX [Blastocatellia bacterium]